MSTHLWRALGGGAAWRAWIAALGASAGWVGSRPRLSQRPARASLPTSCESSNPWRPFCRVPTQCFACSQGCRTLEQLKDYPPTSVDLSPTHQQPPTRRTASSSGSTRRTSVPPPPPPLVQPANLLSAHRQPPPSAGLQAAQGVPAARMGRRPGGAPQRHPRPRRPAAQLGQAPRWVGRGGQAGGAAGGCVGAHQRAVGGRGGRRAAGAHRCKRQADGQAGVAGEAVARRCSNHVQAHSFLARHGEEERTASVRPMPCRAGHFLLGPHWAKGRRHGSHWEGQPHPVLIDHAAAFRWGWVGVGVGCAGQR